MICAYDQHETEFAGNGLCTLLPTSCTVTEQAGGMYELEMEHPITYDGRWKYLTENAIVRAPVPAVAIDPAVLSRADLDGSSVIVETPYTHGTLVIPYDSTSTSWGGSVSIEEERHFAVNWSIDSDVSGMTVRLVTERNFVCYGISSNGVSPVWQRFVNTTPGSLVEFPVPESIWRGKRSGSFNFYLWNSYYSNAVYKRIRFVITTAETPTPTTTVRLRESAQEALLRSGPSVSAPILERIPPETTWYDLGVENVLFHKARSRNGKSGYILTRDTLPAGTETVSMTEDFVAGERARQWHEQPFRIYSVKVDTAKLRVSVKARHLSYDFAGVLAGSLNVEDALNYATVCARFQDNAFFSSNDPHAYTPSIVCTIPGGSYTGDLSFRNGIQLLLDPDVGLVQHARARLLRDGRDFYLLADEETDRGVQIAFGRNLQGVTWEKDTSDVVTRLIPAGTDSDGNALLLPETFLDSPNIDAFPVVRMQKLDVKEAAEGKKDESGKTLTKADCYTLMREAAQKEFEAGCDMAALELTVEFTMLGDTEEYAQYRQLEQVFLYDTVHISHAPTGFSATARVCQYEWDCIARRYRKITVGDVFAVDGASIAGYQLPSGVVSGTKIAAGTVTAGNLADASITNAKISSAGIDVAKINSLVATVASVIRLQVGQASIESLDAQTASLISAEISSADIASLQAEVLNAVAAEIASATIQTAQIEQLDANTATIVKALIHHAAMESAEVQDLSADLADIVFARVAEAQIDGAQIKDLTVTEAKIQAAAVTAAKIAQAAISSANIQDAAITTAKIDNGAVTQAKIGIAAVGTAQIQDAAITDAKIGSAGISYAHIKDLTADEALIEKGVGEKFFFRKLAVDSAQMVDLTVGQLCVKAADNNYYSLSVDLETGYVTATQATVTEGEITAGQTQNGQHIVETALTVSDLNASSVQAVEALISKLTAARIDVDELFARQATIQRLTTGTIAAALGESLNLASNQSVVTTVSSQVQTRMAEAAPAVVKIDSSRGTAFKSNTMSTELRARVYWNGDCIENRMRLREVFGSGAYLQWEWRRTEDSGWSTLLATDSHISDDGFVFSVTPADVDAAITFRCSLITA